MNTLNFLTSFVKRMRSRATIDPVRDWLVLLTTAFIILLCMIVWNVWAFDTVAGGGTLHTQTTKPSAALTNSSLETIHTIFEKRATEEAKYRTGTYRYADPSQ